MPVPRLFVYSGVELAKLLAAHGSQQLYPNVSRDSDGSKLYLQSGLSALILSSSGGMSTQPVPSYSASFGDDGLPVAWIDARYIYHFRGGHEIDRRTLTSVVRVDPSGEFFAASTTPQITEIRRLDPFNRVVATVPFEVRWLFSSATHLYVFGENDRGNAVLGRVFVRHDTGFVFRENLEVLPVRRVGRLTIEDFDVSSETVLLRGGDDLGTSFFLYHLTDRTRVDLGRSDRFGFFLQDDIIAKTLGSLPHARP